MSSRSLNRVMLIGNLTRDPNLRFTPSNTAVCSFGLATNRTWSSDTGDKQESVEFHNIVAWSKLAEICSQLLHKGDKVYVDGRLQTRSWQAEDGNERRVTEVVIENMIMLRSSNNYMADEDSTSESGGMTKKTAFSKSDKKPVVTNTTKKTSSKQDDVVEQKEKISEDSVEQVEDVADDIPF